MGGAKHICAEKGKRRKAKGYSRKEREWRREKNRRMEKEVKREKAHHVISGVHQTDGHPPKKTHGRWSRLLTNTIGGLAWHLT